MIKVLLPIKGLNVADYVPQMEKSLGRSKLIKNGAASSVIQMVTSTGRGARR